MIVAFWVYNESYDNDPARFTQEMEKWIAETLKQNYSGKGAPRLVICAPIMHENLNTLSPTQVESIDMSLKRNKRSQRRNSRRSRR